MNKKKLKGLTALSAVLTLSLAGGILAGCGGKEDHTLSAVNEVAATCTTDGHRSYYKCTDDGCGKYFADAEGKEELSAEDVVLHALGHNPVHHEEKDVTCTEDGNAEYWGCSRCDAKFADENQTPFDGDPVLTHPGHQFTEVTPATDPEPNKAGNVEYWHCDRCEKNYNNSYGDKEIEDVTIPAIAKLDSVTLKLKGYREGETGNLSGNVTLTGKYDQTASGSLTDGVGTVANVYAMEYDVECNGYVGKLAFEAGKSEYELTLEYNYATSTGESATTTDPELPDNKKSTVDLSKMNDKNHTIVLSDGTYATKDYTEAKLTLPREVQGSKNVSISFTLKFLDNSMYEGNVGDSGFNPLSRVGVKMADKKGVFFMMMDKKWHNDGEGNPSDALYVCPIQPKDYVPDGKEEVEGTFSGWDNANEGRFAAVAEALKGDGLQIRMVRAKTYIRMFLKLDGAWVEVMNVAGVAECDENAETDIRLLINGHKWEFSNIEYGSMTEESYKASSVTEAGHQAYLAIDDMYFNPDGTLSSLEELTIPQLSPITSVALTLKDESGNAVTTGTNVKISNVLSEIADIQTTVGENGVVTLAGTTGVYAGLPYVVKVEGYAGTYTITFEGTTATIETLVLPEWEYSSASSVKVVAGSGNWANGTLTDDSTDDKIAFTAAFPVSKEVVVNTGTSFGGSVNYTLYFNLKMTGTNGWENRFGIRLTEGTGESVVGFYFFQQDQGAIKVGALRGKIDFNTNGGEAASTLNASMFVNGLEMKAVREQNKVTLYAKIGGKWEKVSAEVTLSGGYGALGFSASQGTFEYTDVALDIKPAEDQTFSLTLKDGEGNALSEGTTVLLTNPRGETVSKTTDAQGNVTLESPYFGDFIVEVNGTMFVVNFSADSLTVSKSISTAWTYTGKECEVTEHKIADQGNVVISHDETSVTVAATWDNNDWKRDEVYVNVGDALGDSTNYIVRFKITATLAGNWTERFGIRVVSKENDNNADAGFLIWDKGGDGICFGNLANYPDFGGGGPSDKTVLTEAMFAAGVDIQIIRNGNSATMYAKIDGKWQSVYTVSLADGSTAQLGFSAAGGTYVYSDMSIVTVSDTVSE